MAVFEAEKVKGTYPARTPNGAGEVASSARGSYSLPNTHALNDLVKLAVLPAGCVPVDFILDCDELDSGANALVLDVGLLNSAGDDVEAGTLLIDGTTVGQAGGVAKLDQSSALRLAASDEDRVVVAKVVTAAGTAAAGEIGGRVLFQAE